MKELNEELGRRLSLLRDQGLYRELRRLDSPQSPHIEIDGQPLLNFSSNDYLGLANDPQLKQAAIETVERFGCGSGASPLICGRLLPHDQLEQTLAAFKRTEAALCFSSGYAAALGTICALLDKDDVIVIDKLVHACIVDAARLCRAKLRVFAHNDLTELQDILSWADRRHSSASSAPAMVPSRRSHTLIVTESVFSMDGDHAALRELVALKEKFGAWLMVDEAHATGLYGLDGRGLAEAEGVADRIEIQMGTLGKALGASGGYVCGSRTLIDFLVNRARSFIFSTAAVPAAAAAAMAGIEFLKTPAGEQRRTQLWQRVDQILEAKDRFANTDSLSGARATSNRGLARFPNTAPLSKRDPADSNWRRKRGVAGRLPIAGAENFHSGHSLSNGRARPGPPAAHGNGRSQRRGRRPIADRAQFSRHYCSSYPFNGRIQMFRYRMGSP